MAGGLLANNVLYLMAMARIGPAEANVISYLWPILLVLIASRTNRSRLNRGQWLGLGAAFVGAALAIGPTFAHGFDLLGVGLAFASGLIFAVYAAVRSRGQEQHDVIGPSMGFMAVLAMGLHLAFEITPHLDGSQLLVIAAIGVAPLTLSNVLWDLAQSDGAHGDDLGPRLPHAACRSPAALAIRGGGVLGHSGRSGADRRRRARGVSLDLARARRLRRLRGVIVVSSTDRGSAYPPAVPLSRLSTFRTVVACHCPPRAVLTPRAFSSAAT